MTRPIGWILFWAAATILALLVLPVTHNTSAIPMMVFAIIVLATASALWGGGATGRRLAVSGAALVLVLSALSFFLPLTAKRVPEKVKDFDTWLASPSPSAATATATNTPPVVHERVVVQKVGKVMQTFMFADYVDNNMNGCVPLKLERSANFYPLGGAITINPPKGKPWTNELGKAHDMSGTLGVYLVCKASPQAVGFEMWQ